MEILFGTLCYIVPTFPLAYFWHLKFFGRQYTKWGYFGIPSPPLGLLSMVVQGVVLSCIYFSVYPQPGTFWQAMAFAGVMGLFHWSIHVIAAMAKQAESRNWSFFLLESLYLMLQFGIYGLVLGLVSPTLAA
jgi:hypothetical protein